jgi:hypothetical protein
VDHSIGFGFISQTPIISDLSPEVMRVGANSVKAVIGGGDDNRQHLSLAAA